MTAKTSTRSPERPAIRTQWLRSADKGDILFSPQDMALETGLSLSCVYRNLKALKRSGLA